MGFPTFWRLLYVQDDSQCSLPFRETCWEIHSVLSIRVYKHCIAECGTSRVLRMKRQILKSQMHGVRILNPEPHGLESWRLDMKASVENAGPIVPPSVHLF